jgi:hypothetical protein
MTEATPPGTTGSSGTAIRDELSNDASRLTQTATDRVEQAADGRKQQATSAAYAVSSAIEKAAGALRDDDKAPDWLTTAFEKTARQVEELAKTVEGKDIAEIRRGVTQFARQSPTAFLAASAAVGFAAARFLRAGSEFQGHRQATPPGSTPGENSGSNFGSTGMGSGGSANGFASDDGSDAGFNGGSAAGAVGAMSGADLGANGGSTGAAGADQTAWAPAPSPLENEGTLS